MKRRIESREVTQVQRGDYDNKKLGIWAASLALTVTSLTALLYEEPERAPASSLSSETVDRYDYYFKDDSACIRAIERNYYDNLTSAYEYIDKPYITGDGLQDAQADVLIQNVEQATKIGMVHNILQSAFINTGIEIVFELDDFEADNKPYSSEPMTLDDTKMAAKTAIEFLSVAPSEMLSSRVVSTIYISKNIRYEITDPETTDEDYRGAGGVTYSSGDTEEGARILIAANVDVDTYFHEYMHAIFRYAENSWGFKPYDFECINPLGYGYQGSFVNNLAADDPVRLKMEATTGVFETIYGSTNMHEDIATIGTRFRYQSIDIGANEVDENALNAKRALMLNEIYRLFGHRVFRYFVDVETAYGKGMPD